MGMAGGGGGGGGGASRNKKQTGASYKVFGSTHESMAGGVFVRNSALWLRQ